jgi:hypothetical protein
MKTKIDELQGRIDDIKEEVLKNGGNVDKFDDGNKIFNIKSMIMMLY